MTRLFANEEIGPYDHTIADGPKAFGFPESHSKHPDMIAISEHFEEVFRQSIRDEKLPVLSEMVAYVESLNCHERIKLQLAVSIGASITKFEADFSRIKALKAVARKLGVDVDKMSNMSEEERNAYIDSAGQNLAQELSKDNGKQPEAPTN